MEVFFKNFQKIIVTFIWIKGHAENVENEKCDYLAVSAAENEQLKIDAWYENSKKNNTLF